MGVALVIWQYTHFEFSYDKFHHNYEHTYRVVIDEATTEGSRRSSPYTSFAFGETAAREITGIDEYVRVRRADEDVIVANPAKGEPLTERGKVFNYPLHRGVWGSALAITWSSFRPSKKRLLRMLLS